MYFIPKIVVVKRSCTASEPRNMDAEEPSASFETLLYGVQVEADVQ